MADIKVRPGDTIRTPSGDTIKIRKKDDAGGALLGILFLAWMAIVAVVLFYKLLFVHDFIVYGFAIPMTVLLIFGSKTVYRHVLSSHRLAKIREKFGMSHGFPRTLFNYSAVLWFFIKICVLFSMFLWWFMEKLSSWWILCIFGMALLLYGISPTKRFLRKKTLHGSLRRSGFVITIIILVALGLIFLGAWMSFKDSGPREKSPIYMPPEQKPVALPLQYNKSKTGPAGTVWKESGWWEDAFCRDVCVREGVKEGRPFVRALLMKTPADRVEACMPDWWGWINPGQYTTVTPIPCRCYCEYDGREPIMLTPSYLQ